MYEPIICTRLFRGTEVTLQSLAGLAVRSKEGRIYSFLFDNQDPNIAIKVMQHSDADSSLSAFHVFLGKYANSLTLGDIEFFRFHGESWPSYYFAGDEPECIGEEVHRYTGPNRISRHAYEHLGGLYLVNPVMLSFHMQAGSPLVKTGRKYSSDSRLYRLESEYLPHPGIYKIWEEDIETAAAIRRKESQQSHYLM